MKLYVIYIEILICTKRQSTNNSLNDETPIKRIRTELRNTCDDSGQSFFEENSEAVDPSGYATAGMIYKFFSYTSSLFKFGFPWSYSQSTQKNEESTTSKNNLNKEEKAARTNSHQKRNTESKEKNENTASENQNGEDDSSSQNKVILKTIKENPKEVTINDLEKSLNNIQKKEEKVTKDKITTNKSDFSKKNKNEKRLTFVFCPKYLFPEKCIMNAEKYYNYRSTQGYLSMVMKCINLNYTEYLCNHLKPLIEKTHSIFGDHNVISETNMLFYDFEYSILFKEIQILENALYLRFEELYKFVTKQDFIVKSFFVKDKTPKDLETIEEISRFFNTFILDFNTLNYFFDEEIEKGNKQDILQLGIDNIEYELELAIDDFNHVYSNFISNIYPLVTGSFAKYFTHYDYYYFNKIPSIQKERELIWILELFRFDKNKILLILFPELKFFIEAIIREKRTDINISKRDHLFFTFITFKLQIIRPLFEKLYKETYKNPSNFSFFDCHLINYMVFEIKAYISFFASNFMSNEDVKKVLIYKTFLSFLRLQYPKMLKHFMISEFMDTNKCLIGLISADICLEYKKEQIINEVEIHYGYHLITKIGKFIFKDELRKCGFDYSELRSFHLPACPLFRGLKKYNDYQIFCLNEENLTNINSEVRKFIFPRINNSS
ncbi:hypothetical protein TUBRATIS_009320 [Tubulinosema ratisbonensis]|uniref:Uncharacterized protein n=1 Tax=Tubulinosema ratisbonensis TaxID=291195 RepID=A0A437AMX1_9MICR|nr:hypothetical protein TUBRATIS_009320 [Tubulinosema ratisbonensis]